MAIGSVEYKKCTPASKINCNFLIFLKYLPTDGANFAAKTENHIYILISPKITPYFINHTCITLICIEVHFTKLFSQRPNSSSQPFFPVAREQENSQGNSANMAAACAFCVFRLYPTPSDFNSTNFLQKPPLDPNIQTAGQKDRCNNSLQHKLAANFISKAAPRKKKKKSTCTAQHIQITFERIVVWSYRAHKHELRMIATKAPVTLYLLWMRKDAGTPLCYLPKWCGSCGEIFWEWRNPPLRISKWRNERVFPGHFFSLLETELPNLISVNLSVLFLICARHWRPMLHCWWGIIMLRSAPRTHSSAIMQGQVLNLQMHSFHTMPLCEWYHVSLSIFWLR